jgi:hypothetical protein
MLPRLPQVLDACPVSGRYDVAMTACGATGATVRKRARGQRRMALLHSSDLILDTKNIDHSHFAHYIANIGQDSSTKQIASF